MSRLTSTGSMLVLVGTTLLGWSLLGVAGCGSTPAPDPVDAGGTETVLYDDSFDATSCTAPRCAARTIATACTCVPTPRTDAMLATNRTGCSQLGTNRSPALDFCDAAGANAAPDLGCFMPMNRRAPMTSRMVTVFGVVDVFGNGGNADNITVEIHTEGPDGTLGMMIGSATASITHPCVETEALIRNDVPTGDQRELGFYSIPNVPTETPLIVVTRGNIADVWSDVYTYNVVALEEEVEDAAPPMGACAGTPSGARFVYRARTLSRGDYISIPLTAGGIRIPASNGAIAGEVHDCGDVRLEFAQVSIEPRPETIVFFTDNPDNPLPDVTRAEGTSLLGLYAGLNVAPGPVRVAALGRINGEVVSLGWYPARVFAGAVTSVTLRGLRPHQTGL